MSTQEIDDVVAWLAAQRPQFAGGLYPNAAKAAGVEHYFVEQEPPFIEMPALEAAKADYDYLHALS